MAGAGAGAGGLPAAFGAPAYLFLGASAGGGPESAVDAWAQSRSLRAPQPRRTKRRRAVLRPLAAARRARAAGSPAAPLDLPLAAPAAEPGALVSLVTSWFAGVDRQWRWAWGAQGRKACQDGGFPAFQPRPASSGRAAAGGGLIGVDGTKPPPTVEFLGCRLRAGSIPWARLMARAVGTSSDPLPGGPPGRFNPDSPASTEALPTP